VDPGGCSDPAHRAAHVPCQRHASRIHALGVSRRPLRFRDRGARAGRGDGPRWRQMTSAMAAEIAEIPAAARRLIDDTTALRRVAEALSARKFAFAVLCGRGSSGHVGVYLRYLIETRLGLVVSPAAPSVLTNYRRHPAM